jgi:signal transduction histidine kinase
VNISANLVADKVRHSSRAGLSKAAALLHEHADDVGGFIATDEKGKQLPAYLSKLAEHLADEQTVVLDELKSLTGNVEHIKTIVSMQQEHAKKSGLTERFSIIEVINDVLRLNEGSVRRYGIQLVRNDDHAKQLEGDREKAFQILVNLVRNAKDALRDSTTQDKCLTVRTSMQGDDRVRVEVVDNGVGIAAENMARIFTHGFTTKKDGHGFGLHNSALAAKEMGGSLTAHSDGRGRGATFALELPVKPVEATDEQSR